MIKCLILLLQLGPVRIDDDTPVSGVTRELIEKEVHDLLQVRVIID